MGLAVKISKKHPKNDPKEMKFTLKTANSSTGSGIFLRVSANAPNPVKYTDPDGKDIESGTPEQNGGILAAINKYSYRQYRFNNEGKLEGTGDININGSEGYSDYIDAAIAIKDTTIRIFWYDQARDAPRGVEKSETQQPLSKKTMGNVVNLYLIGDDDSSMIMADGSIQNASMARKMVHELAGHAIPMADALSWGDKVPVGDSLYNENVVMIQAFLNSGGKRENWKSVWRVSDPHPSYWK